MSAEKERDQALGVLGSNLSQLSRLYEECYLSMGGGALMVYASDVIEHGIPSKIDYRTKKEILDMFDAPPSHAKMEKMIDDCNQGKEGVMALITGFSNATFFVTFELQ